MQIRKIIEGATDTVRNAAATTSLRLNDLGSFVREIVQEGRGTHRGRRMAVLGLATAVFTVTGATAGLAVSSTEEPVETVAAEAVESDEPSEEDSEKAEDEQQAKEDEEKAEEEAKAKEEEEKKAEEKKKAEEESDETVVPDPVSGLDEEQMGNAVTIIEAGKEEGFDEKGWAVALATGMQEAKLYNAGSSVLPESWDYTDTEFGGSDHDSVGVFQQRPSMGWGTVKELMDVNTSAKKFYGGLKNIKGWESMSIAEAAQSVQVSAFPDHYAKWEGLAGDIIDAYKESNS